MGCTESSTRKEPLKKKAVAWEPVWECEVRKGVWVPYAAIHQFSLEEAFKATGSAGDRRVKAVVRRCKLEVLTERKGAIGVVVSFNSMTQRNDKSTRLFGKRRPVRRRLVEL